MADKIPVNKPKWTPSVQKVLSPSSASTDLMVQISAFLALSVGLFVVFSCVLYFNVTLPPRYRPQNWIVVGSFLSAFILLLCAIGGGVGLFHKLLAG